MPIMWLDINAMHPRMESTIIVTVGVHAQSTSMRTVIQVIMDQVPHILSTPKGLSMWKQSFTRAKDNSSAIRQLWRRMRAHLWSCQQETVITWNTWRVMSRRWLSLSATGDRTLLIGWSTVPAQGLAHRQTLISHTQICPSHPHHLILILIQNLSLHQSLVQFLTYGRHGRHSKKSELSLTTLLQATREPSIKLTVNWLS